MVGNNLYHGLILAMVPPTIAGVGIEGYRFLISGTQRLLELPNSGEQAVLAVAIKLFGPPPE